MEFPLLGQQVAIDLANTSWVYAGRHHDALATIPVADRWIRAVAHHKLGDGGSLAEAVGSVRAVRVTDEQFRADLSELRDLVRELLTSAAADAKPRRTTLAALTGLSAAAPSHLHAVAGRADGVELARRRPAPAGPAILAALADDALLMLRTDASAAPVLSCPGPGCLGLFVQDDPRRAFCSPACATRARVARHYARRRALGDGTP